MLSSKINPPKWIRVVENAGGRCGNGENSEGTGQVAILNELVKALLRK